MSERDYKIVSSYSITTLEGAVFFAIRDGFLPLGGPFIVDEPNCVRGDGNDCYIQAHTVIKRYFCQAVYRAPSLL